MPPARRELQLRQLQRAASGRSKPKPKTKPVLVVRKRLLELPPELLARIVSLLPSADDVGRLDCVSHAFHTAGEPPLPSVVEDALRMRRASTSIPEELPAQELSWTQKLLWDERRLQLGRPAVVAAGAMHSVFIDPSSCLLICGVYHASAGFLGHGIDVIRVTEPTAVPSIADVAIHSVAVRHHHTLAIGAADGLVYACGRGDCGRLGNGSEEHAHTPIVVEAMRAVDVRTVSAGRDHSLFSDADGLAYSCGASANGRLGHGAAEADGNVHVPRLVESLRRVRVCSVAAGDDVSFFLTDRGRVFSCGVGEHGALGHGGTADERLPRVIDALCAVRVRYISAGRTHALFVGAAGEVYSCGLGIFGRLGHGHDRKLLVPCRIEALADVHVTCVAAGEGHSLFVTSSGSAFSCGWNVNGQCGQSDVAEVATPCQIESLSNVRGVAAGYAHSLAFDAEGRVFGWGNGADECLGLQLHGDLPAPMEYAQVRVKVASEWGGRAAPEPLSA